jgi:hypothetical protein
MMKCVGRRKFRARRSTKLCLWKSLNSGFPKSVAVLSVGQGVYSRAGSGWLGGVAGTEHKKGAPTPPLVHSVIHRPPVYIMSKFPKPLYSEYSLCFDITLLAIP